MSADAGWYPEPGAPGSLRYWDGSTWTEQRHAAQAAPPPYSPPPPAPEYGQRPAAGRQASASWWLKPLLLVGIPAIVALVAVFLPWVEVFGVSVSGLDTNDGKLSLGVVIGGLVLLALVRFRITLAVVQCLVGLAVGAIGIANIIDINDEVGTTDLVGIGLWITAIAGAVWAVAALATLAVRRPSRR